jgi:hypothetical protein
MKKFLALFAKKKPTVAPNGNCPINERAGDGVLVGRCWFNLYNGVCHRHGDVSKEFEIFQTTGLLTPETLEHSNKKSK